MKTFTMNRAAVALVNVSFGLAPLMAGGYLISGPGGALVGLGFFFVISRIVIAIRELR
jgi:hypothetical protein